MIKPHPKSRAPTSPSRSTPEKNDEPSIDRFQAQGWIPSLRARPSIPLSGAGTSDPPPASRTDEGGDDDDRRSSNADDERRVNNLGPRRPPKSERHHRVPHSDSGLTRLRRGGGIVRQSAASSDRRGIVDDRGEASTRRGGRHGGRTPRSRLAPRLPAISHRWMVGSRLETSRAGGVSTRVFFPHSSFHRLGSSSSLPPSKVLSSPLTREAAGVCSLSARCPPPPPIWDTLRSIDGGGRSSRAAERSAPIAIGFVLCGLVYASEEEVGGVITIVIGGRWGNCGRASPSEFLEAEDGASTTTAATARPMDRDVDRTTTMTTILRHLVVPGDDDGARRRRAGGSRSSSRRPAPRRMRRHGPPMAIVRSYLLPVLRLRYRSSLGLGRTNNLYFG